MGLRYAWLLNYWFNKWKAFNITFTFSSSADTKLHFVQGKLHERLHPLSALLAITTPCFTHYFKVIIQGGTVVFKESRQLEESRCSSDWFF